MIATYGLTGGIASGKTTVSNIFTELGIPVVDADVVARQVTEEPAIHQKIATHFGSLALLPNGHLDRAWLRQRIFTTPQEKRWLEQLLHPAIRLKMQHIRSQTQGAYMILVIPLLIENIDNYTDLTGIIVVDADESQQQQRLKARDQHDPRLIENIIKTQSKRQQRLAHADFILHNHQDLQDLRKQVLALHQLLLQKHGEAG